MMQQLRPADARLLATFFRELHTGPFARLGYGDAVAFACLDLEDCDFMHGLSFLDGMIWQKLRTEKDPIVRDGSHTMRHAIASIRTMIVSSDMVKLGPYLRSARTMLMTLLDWAPTTTKETDHNG